MVCKIDGSIASPEDSNMETKRTLRAKEVCMVAGLRPSTLRTWVNQGLLQLDQPGQTGWRKYTFDDLLRVCAWAEVNRIGISPVSAKRLTYELEGRLQDFAQEGLTAPTRAARFLLAEIWQRAQVEDPEEKDLMNVRFAAWGGEDGVAETLQAPASRYLVPFASVVIIDTVKVWERIQGTLQSGLFANIDYLIPDSE
jgi:DNA-binding transcriptional MerR regulator